MTRREGLVRIRERVAWQEPPNSHEAAADATSSASDGHMRRSRSAGRLSDDTWYFCVARAPVPALEWFTVDAGTESSDDEDASPSASAGGAVLLVSTRVSRVEAVDGDASKLPEEEEENEGEEEEEDGFAGEAVDETERRRLETCSFYMEDDGSGLAFLIETESQEQRDQWVQFLSDLLPPEDEKKAQEQETIEQEEEERHEEERHEEAEETDVVEELERLLLHHGVSDRLDEETDAFGLLSLTTSALSSLAFASDPKDGNSVVATAATNAAPGMFAMDHIEISEGDEDVEEMEDTDDSAANTDGDGAADTEMAPALLTSASARRRQQFSQSGGNLTDPTSGSTSLDAIAASRDRRHSLGASTATSTGCHRCKKRFGRLIRTPKICASCDRRFCREHCCQWIALTSPESLTPPPSGAAGSHLGAAKTPAPVLKRVCMDCLVRQQLLTSLQEAGVYYASAVDEAGGLSRLVRWKYFDQTPKHEIEDHVRAQRLGPLSLLSAMFKYRQQPFMFVVVLAQLVQNVENCVETVDFYWPQFLQWGFVHLPDASPSVRAFYLFFLAATARRSVHLAVKATWECIAAHWDAMTCGRFKRGNGIVVMLFFVTNVNFGEPRSVLPQLLFPHAPSHQREVLETLLSQLYEYVRRVYAVSQREAPFFAWLLARSQEELVLSSQDVQRQLRAGGGFLDPFPSDYHEEVQLMLLERRRSGTQHLVEVQQRLRAKPAQHIFSDEVQLVRFLVDLCTYLKESTPDPAQRKRQLPALLREMLRGKHIRPEAALPLASVSARGHRVVNVLTDEGTVFSTKARAPTLVFFEVIASSLETTVDGEFQRPMENENENDEELDAVVQAAVELDEARDGLDPEQLEILNYLDGDAVETYVADLIPAVRTESQVSMRSSISEDLDGLSLVLPAGCTPLSDKGDGVGNFSDDESDGNEDDDHEFEGETNGSSGSATSSSRGKKCPFFGERFADTQERIREESAFARFDGWALLPVIAKSFDDMRQEVFVLQGLKLFQLIFRKHGLPLWMRYYSIVCAGKDCGLLEVITDAQSLDGLKKQGKKVRGVGTSLPKIFERACGRDPVTGEHDPVRVERARENFVSSMAAYSLFSYIFLVKDRHNGNIMLDTAGHVVHIDFGFVLGIAPGNSFSLETAPFKLTPEMVDVMGVDGFERYRQLVTQGLLALHLEAPQLLSLVYLSSKESCFPCFQGRSRARIVRRLQRRLCVGWSVLDVEHTAAHIVDKSHGHRGTRRYDWFQRLTNGILP
ncbi:hypothetical protein BBJ28_00016889 [Nothophytophthora sp. Chile5]|nr:hypothetical protein BBJ28_00016889 [Nothophytophthora sp. Chile5]